MDEFMPLPDYETLADGVDIVENVSGGYAQGTGRLTPSRRGHVEPLHRDSSGPLHGRTHTRRSQSS